MSFKNWLQMIEDYAMFADEPFFSVPKWYQEWWEQEQFTARDADIP